MPRDNNRHHLLIDRACRRIETAETAPDLATLAAEAGLSPWHFQRLFKAAVGISPKRYALAWRRQRLDRALRAASSVTDAIYGAGYAAASAAYRDSQHLGMAPSRLATGGVDEEIRHATTTTSLGPILVAATARGICMVEFGAARTLLAELHRRFPRARIEPADARMRELVRHVAAAIDDSAADPALPLDIRGTAFQVRVWQALTQLASGETISYAELAARVGAPGSARAVARACASNGIAVLVPCHRVVASDGALTGYRWGIARKRRLLRREQAAVKPQTVR
ncbi:MAG TPA: methylated-DNA--[protein]-cysteine S-methyltransferase [Steroidobacteraceae bacterium]|nr:methylated-DNA--[protein]-cysteine S-methyltransferase [Steroidobacteraceae bacterium]